MLTFLWLAKESELLALPQASPQSSSPPFTRYNYMSSSLGLTLGLSSQVNLSYCHRLLIRQFNRLQDVMSLWTVVFCWFLKGKAQLAERRPTKTKIQSSDGEKLASAERTFCYFHFCFRVSSYSLPPPSLSQLSNLIMETYARVLICNEWKWFNPYLGSWFCNWV